MVGNSLRDLFRVEKLDSKGDKDIANQRSEQLRGQIRPNPRVDFKSEHLFTKTTG